MQREKIPVGVLGATGMVGQKFVELLTDHPWFEVVALAASERSEGKSYSEAMAWRMPTALNAKIASLKVNACEPSLPCGIVFSGLDASVAGEVETNFANAGYRVISNARNHRMDPVVPLLIPEVNPDHLGLIIQQRFNNNGKIVTNPNCSVIGLATALKPLDDIFGLKSAHVVTLQAISGAGYPGVSSFDITDNVIPFISGEEDKVEKEPLKILGKLLDGKVVPHQVKLSAHCNRVGVIDGHMACVSVKLERPATPEAIIEAWQQFTAEPQTSQLPSAPERPIIYLDDERHPQPRLHRHLGNGMTVVVGRLRPCPLMDWKFVVLSHNTIRGAAGCAILNAELMLQRGLA